ncbi:hypothetical protein Syun_019360 [Stephania yunnanensis]|uniref:Uncharacterized protein n=1 Tax=Stephania yunnanensis TaxID=152371 RepID=A0AAP0IVP4_9MAGN
MADALSVIPMTVLRNLSDKFVREAEECGAERGGGVSKHYLLMLGMTDYNTNGACSTYEKRKCEYENESTHYKLLITLLNYAFAQTNPKPINLLPNTPPLSGQSMLHTPSSHHQRPLKLGVDPSSAGGSFSFTPQPPCTYTISPTIPIPDSYQTT